MSFAKSAVVLQAGSSCVGDVCTLKYAAAVGDTSVSVYYDSAMHCIVGAHNTNNRSAGCFSVGTDLVVAGVSIGRPSFVTNVYRTLQGFSRQAAAKMAGQQHFEKFLKYYGRGDYGDNYIMEALDGTGIFTGADSVVRVEAAKKAAVCMNVWMYAIREMEDAIADCKAGCINCNEEAVHGWDEAVAFYTGSLVGADGRGAGKLLYSLADKRCRNYNTCDSGKHGNLASGTSKVNKEIMWQFKLGQDAMLKTQCGDVDSVKDAIVKLMLVPLIQGALRYAFKIEKLQGGEKERGEGAVFAASVLPMIAHCDEDAAKIISDNMKVDSKTPMSSGFLVVKRAFERTYACMGITCADVGGMLLTDNPVTYQAEFNPCVDKRPAPHGSSDIFGDGGVMSKVAATPILFAIFFFGGLFHLAALLFDPPGILLES